MTRFKIPRSPQAVTDALGEIGELLTATEWKRAALLAAVVRLPGQGVEPHGRMEKRGIALFTAPEFAALDIKGLRSANTVRLYVQRWLDANDGEYPQLGASVTLPTDDWPPTRTGTDGYESTDGAKRTLGRMVEEHGADAVAGLIVDDEKLSSAIKNEELDRYVPMAARQEMAQRNREMATRFDSTVREAKATAADHIPHDALYGLMAAEQHVKAALRKLEQFPFRSESQQAEIDASATRLLQLLELVVKPTPDWSDADRGFLAEAGIEDFR